MGGAVSSFVNVVVCIVTLGFVCNFGGNDSGGGSGGGITPSPVATMTTLSPVTPTTPSPATASPVVLLGPGWYLSTMEIQGCNGVCNNFAGVGCYQDGLNDVNSDDKLLYLDDNLINSESVCDPNKIINVTRRNAPYYASTTGRCAWNSNLDSRCGANTPVNTTLRFCCCGTSLTDCPTSSD